MGASTSYATGGLSDADVKQAFNLQRFQDSNVLFENFRIGNGVIPNTDITDDPSIKQHIYIPITGTPTFQAVRGDYLRKIRGNITSSNYFSFYFKHKADTRQISIYKIEMRARLGAQPTGGTFFLGLQPAAGAEYGLDFVQDKIVGYNGQLSAALGLTYTSLNKYRVEVTFSSGAPTQVELFVDDVSQGTLGSLTEESTKVYFPVLIISAPVGISIVDIDYVKVWTE